VRFRCRAVLFDLDGVLVDSRVVVERTWRRWAERHQLDPDDILRIAHGRRTRDTLKEVNPRLATDAEISWLDTAELEDVEGMHTVPGAPQLLAALPPRRWAIVTSCTRDLARLRLSTVGLPVPDVLIVSEEVEQGKPSPEGYRLGASRLGVDPRECVVFEDAPAGIAAGKAAGARVVGLITTHAVADLAAADTTIDDLRSVRVRPDQEELVVTIDPAQ